MDPERKALYLLSERFPNRAAVIGEITELVTSLNMPKGTEHFMSDIHGESEAFSHIMRNASGAIRSVIDLFFPRMKEQIRAELACTVYYPKEKLEKIRTEKELSEEDYRVLIFRLLVICRNIFSKYTRRKSREILEHATGEYAQTIETLMGSLCVDESFTPLFNDSVKSIIRLGCAEEFICAICAALRRGAVERIHIIGDIFDRGGGAHAVIDTLMARDGVDIEWGNHDVLMIGAACGSLTCIATVIKNCIFYSTTDTIEGAYGISLMPLAMLAQRTYSDARCDVYAPREWDGSYLKEKELFSKMHKAISIILFKLEGDTIKRNPLFCMNDRCMLENIDFASGKIKIEDTEYELRDCDFPTVMQDDPYRLTQEEAELMRYFKSAFTSSRRLNKHVKFLLAVGGMYKIYNRNLLFHGCIPMDEEGNLLALPCAEGRCGRALMDFFDFKVREAFLSPPESQKRKEGADLLWFLWCGRNSPLSGREAIKTFERLLIPDKRSWVEPKNPYYRLWDDENLALKILREFSLGHTSHIINGHIPVKKGENPIKGGGRVIVIDGGFCSAYQRITGISGYTLIYDSHGMNLCAHETFAGKDAAIVKNADIVSKSTVFESSSGEIRVRDTDEGFEIRERLADLIMLLEAYKNGDIMEKNE